MKKSYKNTFSNKIQILHLITDLNSGGAEMMLYKLLSNMNYSLFSNVVVSMTDKGFVGERIEALGIPVHALYMRRGVPDPLGMGKLLRLLKEQRPHILQTWLYHADLLGLIAGKLARVPVVAWNLRCSNMDMSQYSKMSASVVKLLAKLSSFPHAIIVNSEAGKKYHESIGYSSKRWQIIPNGFDLETFHPDPEARIKLRNELGLGSDAILIGLIARFDPMKDHKNFLHAAGLLLKKYPKKDDIHFILVGRNIDPNNSDLTNTISDLELNNQMHLLGERNDTPFVTAALDIACSSSYGEGFPNTIGEAMACGLPCVVTDAGDSALVVGETGKVVQTKNPQAFADALFELISMGGETRKELGKSARQRIADYFSLDSIVHMYENLYREIIDRGN